MSRSPRPPAPGPSWLGIGAQRCGTTWFTEMLCAHPEVVPIRGGDKEGHWFDRFGGETLTPADAAQYVSMFDAAKCSGEFTPAYMRMPWVPSLARSVCPAHTLVVALVRDPVARYRSAMRWSTPGPDLPSRADLPAYRKWVRRKSHVAVWGGMYATQLDAWRRHFGRERMLVIQYELLVRDPAAILAQTWRRLGLDPVALPPAAGAQASPPSARGEWEEPSGLAAELRELYAHEVARCRDEWGVDVSLWKG